MIWYVATLIASVFSTRGTAAQGESKCSVCVFAQVFTLARSNYEMAFYAFLISSL